MKHKADYSRKVKMNMLRRALMVRHYGSGKGSVKLPRHMEGTFKDVSVYNWRGEFIGLHEILVKKGSEGLRRGASPHRVFIVINGRLIPAGRFHQAKFAATE